MNNTPLRITCMVVDDEPLAREVLLRFISREPSLQLIGDCSSAVEALTLIRQNPPDLLLLDIQMPELLGTELLRILRNPPKVILTTAFPQFALEGYDLDVVDYLLKPIQFDRFLKAIHKASTLIGLTPPTHFPTKINEPATDRHDPYLYFRIDRKMIKIMLEDILYIEGMKNYIKIITTHGTLITKHSMAAIEAMLPSSSFLRTHRSFIVSQSKITSYTGEFVGIGKVELPIGKLYKNSLMQSLDQPDRNPK